MKKIEILKIGLKELRSNKLRTSLTMLGIIFGVAAVIAMLSIGEGARQETIEQIELMGTNNIILSRIDKPSGGLSNNEKDASFSPGLNLKDAEAIRLINPFVEYITPQKFMNSMITYKSTLFESNVIGTTPDFIENFNSRLEMGSFLKEIHITSFANVCVIGFEIKERLFKFENPLHKKIKIGTEWFDIIGTVARKNIMTGSGAGNSRDFNEDIYVPISTMSYKMIPLTQNQRNNFFFTDNPSVRVIDKSSIDMLTIKINDSDNLKEAAALIKRIIDRRHFKQPDYDIILPEQLLEQKQKTQKIFNIVMGAIAGISLLVGGIGIMNIMLANILERTKEIGIRRALGATKGDLIYQFIYEALVISIAGGLLGILLGFLFTSLIATYAEWRTIITPSSIILAFFVSAGVGLGFGIYPAKIAADKDPIESLRYE